MLLTSNKRSLRHSIALVIVSSLIGFVFNGALNDPELFDDFSVPVCNGGLLYSQLLDVAGSNKDCLSTADPELNFAVYGWDLFTWGLAGSLFLFWMLYLKRAKIASQNTRKGAFQEVITGVIFGAVINIPVNWILLIFLIGYAGLTFSETVLISTGVFAMLSLTTKYFLRGKWREKSKKMEIAENRP